MVYILIAILIFGVLIAVHELGHFLAAKACGVRVNEFSIGMGPTILHKTKGDTTYSLRLLPIGGFCAMEGEEEDSNDPTALNNQSFWKKLIIFAAGAFMNFLTGLIIIVVLYAGAKAFYVPVITDFADGCPLQSESGLQVGDRLVSIDGERVYVYSDVSLLLGRNKTGVFDLKVKRDGQTVTLKDFPMERAEYTDQQGQTYTGFGLMFGAEEATVGTRLQYSWNNAVDFVRIVRLSLQMLVTGEAGLKDVSGPVGIVSTITDVGEQAESTSAAVENHRLSGGAGGGESGGDEPAAPAGAGRRKDLLSGGQRPVHADHPQENSGKIRELRPSGRLRTADAADAGHHLSGRVEAVSVREKEHTGRGAASRPCGAFLPHRRG